MPLKHTHFQKQVGLSLVELMITMIIALIVIGAALSVFVGTIGANSDQIKIAKVNTELRNAMLFISRDLRRANYQNLTSTEMAGTDFPANRLGTITGPARNNSSSTIEVSYDLNADGTVASTEYFGYTLSGNTLKTHKGKNSADIAFTDDDSIRITNLTITNISPPAVVSVNPTRTSQVADYEISISGEYPGDSRIKSTIRETIRVRNPIVAATP